MQRSLFNHQISIESVLEHSVIRNRQGLLFTSFPGMQIHFVNVFLALMDTADDAVA